MESWYRSPKRALPGQRIFTVGEASKKLTIPIGGAYEKLTIPIGEAYEKLTIPIGGVYEQLITIGAPKGQQALSPGQAKRRPGYYVHILAVALQGQKR